MDIEKEIKNLKASLASLEKSIKTSKNNLFGSSYTSVGTTSSDYCIKTRGKVKIQTGGKFIDLIKDGEINSGSKMIYKQDSIGTKDGIYIIGEDENIRVVLQVDGKQIDLVGEVGTTYVSFLSKQNVDASERQTALHNIGFLYDTIEAAQQDGISSGIIYVEDTKKLYIVNGNAIQEYSVSIPNPYPKQFVISKSDNNTGSLVIKGTGSSNSLKFDSLILYSDSDMNQIEATKNINLKLNGIQCITIDNNKTKINNDIITSMIQSEDANEHNGFRLYKNVSGTTLEVDNLTLRNSDSLLNSIFPKGTILMLNSKDRIPYGWHICDGTNDTPNLIGKFIKAADTAGEEGGSDFIQLSEENLPSHTHTFVSNIISTTDSGEHTHIIKGKYANVNSSSSATGIIEGSDTDVITTSTNGIHSHNIDTNQLELNKTGEGKPLQFTPKYYSLIYIIKII